MSLTHRALARICAGEEVNKPIIQVLGYKRISGSGQERYRILLSDGENSNSFAMMATQLNPMIHAMELEQFTIIKVDKYICNQVQGQSKRVVILLEVSVVTPGDQVHEKLGNPVPMDGAGNIVPMVAGNSLPIGTGNVLPMGARNPDGRSWNSVQMGAGNSVPMSRNFWTTVMPAGNPYLMPAGIPMVVAADVSVPKFVFPKPNANMAAGGASKRSAGNDQSGASVIKSGTTGCGGDQHSAVDKATKKRKTPKKIEDSVKGMNAEVTQNIIGKIDELNMELNELDKCSNADIKRIEDGVKQEVNELELTHEEDLDATLKQEEEELQGVKEYYSQLIKKKESENVMKQGDAKAKGEAEIKDIDENRNATKKAIEQAKKGFITKLHKLQNDENNDEVMPNVKKDMECPICLEEMKPPTSIYQCTFGHLICGGCEDRIEGDKCPTCKVADLIGRAWAMERLARTLYGQP